MSLWTSPLVKRGFDLTVATISLAALSPVLLLVAFLVALLLGRPVFFRQTRPGLHGEPFTILKFRTMLDLRGSDGVPLADDRRLTRFGAFLRSSSLDELPELWNVVRGDMSLVGPRPLLTEYLEFYSTDEARRHAVRPGITGWAQINGRNTASWERRLADDVWYVDHRTIWLDVRILLRTIGKVFRREGISAEGHVTMPPFRGSGSH